MGEAVERFKGFDIIGDVHGCALTLQALLVKLGYSKRHGIFQHHERQAIFVGDIVDRGPRIREALHIVRDMVEEGAARIVMGNHEYNSLGYCTLARPGGRQKYLREHTPRATRMIQETLDQFANYGREWNEFLEWFRTLPLIIEEPGFRVVHACWDEKLIRKFLEQFPEAIIDDDFLHASAVRESFAGHVMDRLLRGTDLPVPKGMKIVSKDGFVRSFFRTKYWYDSPEIYDDVVFQPDALPEEVRHLPISEEDRRKLLFYSAEERPLFIGHYWLDGEPRPIRPNIGCLDYSAVKYGKLVAYRMDGESEIDPSKFVWVDVNKESSQENPSSQKDAFS